MKIATFNINNVNRRLPNLLRWLKQARRDVVCLQELKATDQDFPAAAFEKAGYQAIWRGQKTHEEVLLVGQMGEAVLRQRVCHPLPYPLRRATRCHGRSSSSVHPLKRSAEARHASGSPSPMQVIMPQLTRPGFPAAPAHPCPRTVRVNPLPRAAGRCLSRRPETAHCWLSEATTPRSFRNIALSLPSVVACAWAWQAAALSHASSIRLLMSVLPNGGTCEKCGTRGKVPSANS